MVIEEILILDFHRGMNIDFWFWEYCTVFNVVKKFTSYAVQSPQNQKSVIEENSDFIRQEAVIGYRRFEGS
jgi:hypothetical protein